MIVSDGLNQSNIIIFFNNNSIAFRYNTAFDPVTYGLRIGDIESFTIFCNRYPVLSRIFFTLYIQIIFQSFFTIR